MNAVYWLLGLALLFSFAVLAFAAWRHRVDVKKRAAARLIRESESVVLDEAALAVDEAYEAWLAEGGQAFTGPPPPKSHTSVHDDWFPFD